MKVSAGIAIFWEDKILMAQPKNSRQWERYTPPKGGIEEGETLAQTASRETFEEVGIYIDPNKLNPKKSEIIIYDNSKGKVYKKVHLFEYRIKKLSDIKLKSEILPKNMLQSDEIGEAHFMDWEECEEKSLKRYINYIKKRIG